MSPKSMLGVILLAAVVLLGLESLYVVSERERAVVLRFGELIKPNVQPGLHIKAPFIDKVRIFDGRLLTLDSSPERFLTQEKKALIIDSFVKWRIDNVETFYTATSGDIRRANQLLSQRVESRLRNIVGSKTLQEVVSGERDQLMEFITNNLNGIARQELGVAVADVRIKGIDLPPQVSDSVFERMATERDKEAQEIRSQGNEQAEVIRADADRQKRVLLAEAFRDAEKARGDGDAKAAAIYAKAYNADAEFFSFYRSLQAYKETFRKQGDIMVLDPDSDFFHYLKQSGAK
ncbi:protease modulator HflC [Aestuariirhabdus sp. Z084]|uniref:protease modulator HflC n=1 Tax=Aestuariirhabdus haliotis TaxID=2918751 RepID=UPI00201B41B8|nr:protease modulator HflC [Aestuariirhabdus haliotis]MCL6415640.1 protease modulator HflC [Aestuariirhabdus haliotis]MCL6419635.1 protease modulator HflC [Aestuariirhabdus haliotis]